MDALLSNRPELQGVSRSISTADALSDDDRRHLIDLCSRAFNDDFSRLFSRRPTARHAVVYWQGQPIGHGCWELWIVTIDGIRTPAAWVSAMAVRPEFQGAGVGRSLLAALVADFGSDRLGVLSAARPGFYEHMGWQIWPGPVRREGQDPAEPIMVLPRYGEPQLAMAGQLVVLPRSEVG